MRHRVSGLVPLMTMRFMNIRRSLAASLIALAFATVALCSAAPPPAFAQPASGQQNDKKETKPRANATGAEAGRKGTDAPADGAQEKSKPQGESGARPQAGAAPPQTAPAADTSAPAADQQTDARVAPKTVVVWVNTASRVYHRPGSRWYGKTRHGKYMTEKDAIKAGYRLAGKE